MKRFFFSCFNEFNWPRFVIPLLFFSLFSEHGGHHGHSHGITRSNNKLAQLANTDDNENNSFVYANGVSIVTCFFFFFKI